MMRCTREELLAAADRAEVYPKGHGLEWGYDPENDSRFEFQEDVIAAGERGRQYG
jgi:hypothetical protein